MIPAKFVDSSACGMLESLMLADINFSSLNSFDFLLELMCSLKFLAV